MSFRSAYPDSLNILQVDNGRFHTSKDLIVPENIILRHLSGGYLTPENAVLFQPPQGEFILEGKIIYRYHEQEIVRLW